MVSNKTKSDNLFSGRIYISNLNGDFINGYVVNSGYLIAKLVKKTQEENSNLTARTTLPSDIEENNCPYAEKSLCGELGTVTITASGSGSDSISITYIYSGYTYNNQNTAILDNSTTYSWDYVGGSRGNNVNLSPCDYTINGCDEEDKIDNNQLTGKEKCIDNLLAENGNEFIKILLDNFDGDDSEFDIIIKSVNELISPSGEKDKGQTHSPNSNYEIIIEINSSSVSSMSALETAKTLLHEYIHADIYRKLLTKDNSNQEILSFRDTYNKYKEQFSSQLQHQTMGYLYVNSMRDALKTFHKNVLKSDFEKYTNYKGHEPTDLFYEALAWRGLKEHNIEAYKDIDPEKIEQLEAVKLDIDVLTKDCNDAQ